MDIVDFYFGGVHSKSYYSETSLRSYPGQRFHCLAEFAAHVSLSTHSLIKHRHLFNIPFLI